MDLSNYSKGGFHTALFEVNLLMTVSRKKLETTKDSNKIELKEI